jgi:hypothetical protein
MIGEREKQFEAPSSKVKLIEPKTLQDVRRIRKYFPVNIPQVLGDTPVHTPQEFACLGINQRFFKAPWI